jgi:hypothetical protein
LHHADGSSRTGLLEKYSGSLVVWVVQTRLVILIALVVWVVQTRLVILIALSILIVICS